jgi:hypothetical protein
MKSIFIQIASYRDPELKPTIEDCIAKAKYPKRLTFGICWQYDDKEYNELNDFLYSVPNTTIIEVPHFESKGLCWARSKIQELYNGEDYTMQLDSHHRFVQDWDEILIDMMNMTGSEKPIISTYAAVYEPEINILHNNPPHKMVGKKFTDQGTILFYPEFIDDHEKLTSPIPARFVSGHFFFTLGQHCIEYKYDPNIYFAGDEISLSIRSYTLGYDLFHPHRVVLWHEYTRSNRVKHWDDFNEKNKEKNLIKRTWWEIDQYGKKRLRHLLKEEDNNIDLGEYGLGSIRTHKDYEIYAGINFEHKALHINTINGVDPPVNDYNQWWEDFHNIYLNDIPDFSDSDQLYIGIEDNSGNVLYRTDLTYHSSSLILSFGSKEIPFKVVYWKYNYNGTWGEKIDKLL